MYKIKSIYWILCRPISYALVTPWNCVITCVICVFVKRWCKNLQPYKIIHVLNLLIDSSVKKSNKRTLLWIQVVHHIWLVILVYTSISCYMQNSTRLTPGFHSSFTHLYVSFCCYQSAEGGIVKNNLVRPWRWRWTVFCWPVCVLDWFQTLIPSVQVSFSQSQYDIKLRGSRRCKLTLNFEF